MALVVGCNNIAAERARPTQTTTLGCAGAGVKRLTRRGAPLRGSGLETQWNFSGRYVDTGLERPRWRFTANYRLLSRLQVGVELNAAAKEIGPLATLYLLLENHTRPAIFLGARGTTARARICCSHGNTGS